MPESNFKGATTQFELCRAYHNLGWAFVQRGQLDEGVIHYRQALRLDPENALTYNNLAAVLVLQGLVDEALASYREALRLPDLRRS